MPQSAHGPYGAGKVHFKDKSNQKSGGKTATDVKMEDTPDSGDSEDHHEVFVWGVDAKLRQDWGDDQDTDPADWVDLFYDLFYVAAAVGMSNMLSVTELTPYTCLVAVMYGEAFYASWNHLNLLRSSIHFEGVGFWLVMVINMCALAGAVAEFDANLKYRVSWSYWRLAVYATHGILAAVVMSQLRRAWNVTVYHGICSTIIPSLFHIIVLFLPVAKEDQSEENRRKIAATVLLTLAVQIDLLGQTTLWYIPCLRRRVKFLPLNMHHVMERCELLILVLTGETVISVISKTKGRHDWQARISGVFACWIACCFGTGYFSSLPHDPQFHAMRISPTRALGFQWFQRFLGGSVLGFGCAVKLVLMTMPPEEVNRRLGPGDYGAGPSAQDSNRLLIVQFLFVEYNLILLRCCHKTHFTEQAAFAKLVLRFITPSLAAAAFAVSAVETIFAILSGVAGLIVLQDFWHIYGVSKSEASGHGHGLLEKGKSFGNTVSLLSKKSKAGRSNRDVYGDFGVDAQNLRLSQLKALREQTMKEEAEEEKMADSSLDSSTSGKRGLGVREGSKLQHGYAPKNSTGPAIQLAPIGKKQLRETETE